jgi:branched-chain amino acid transport system permease protein
MMRWLPVAFLLGLAVYPVVFPLPFPQHVVIMALLFAAMGTAWNILGGLAGQVSFGHALYFGIGAYTTAWFYKSFGLSALVTWPVALAISTLAAVVVGVPTFRLRGHYFVLASVFIMQAVYIVVSNWNALGAAIGLELPVHRPSGALDALWHLQFHMSKLPFYYGALALFVATLVTFEWIRRSRVGVLFVALREEEDAARSLGVDTLRYKLLALIVSAAFTTLCGMFYAQYVLYVEPVAAWGCSGGRRSGPSSSSRLRSCCAPISPAISASAFRARRAAASWRRCATLPPAAAARSTSSSTG